MARQTQETKQCKLCGQWDRFAWGKVGGKSVFFYAKLDAQGNCLRDSQESPQPIPDYSRPHRCQSKPSNVPSVPTVPQSALDRAPFAPEAAEQDAQDGPESAPEATVDSADLSMLMASLQAILARPKVDAAAVTRIATAVAQKVVDDTLAAQEPRKVETIIRIVRADKTESKRKRTHPMYARLVRLLSKGFNVYLYGLPGSGKTTGCIHAAEDLGLEFGYISLNPQTPESRILGFLDVNGIYRETDFYRCYVNGGLFVFDEMDNASGAMLTTLNGALENGSCAFPCGVKTMHANFRAVASGNTTGRGGTANHRDRRPFDAATMERFAFIEWQYDEELESQLALDANPLAGAWLGWVRTVRTYAKVNVPTLTVSPRASIRGAKLLAGGVFDTAEQVADTVLFKGLEADTRAAILRACPIPPSVSVTLPEVSQAAE